MMLCSTVVERSYEGINMLGVFKIYRIEWLKLKSAVDGFFYTGSHMVSSRSHV